MPPSFPMQRPMMPQASPQIPQAAQNQNWAGTPFAAAFQQNMNPGQFIQNLPGSVQDYIQQWQANQQAPQNAGIVPPSPMPPSQPMPPQTPQGGPPQGFGWNRPDFPGQGHAYGRMGMSPPNFQQNSPFGNRYGR